MIAAFQTELCRKWGARRINIIVEMSDIYHCIWQKKSSTVTNWDFTGGPVVGNPPSNAGDAGSIPGQGTEIPHNGAAKPASLTTEPKPTYHSERSCVSSLRPGTAK